MRNLNITFTDEDFKKLETAKSKAKMTWEEFIISRCAK